LNNDPLADAIYDIWPMSQDVHALIGTAVQFNRQFLFAFQEPLVMIYWFGLIRKII